MALLGSAFSHTLLVVALAVQAVMTCGLLMILLFQTAIRQRRDLTIRQVKERYIAAIGTALIDEAVRLPMPKNPLETDALAEVAIDVMNSIAGETADRIRGMLLETGVVNHYIRKSKSLSWLKRIYAIERLGLFSLDELREIFTEALKHETVYPVRTRLVWALSRVADEQSLPLITNLLATEISISSKFNEYIYGNIITSFRQKGLQPDLVTYLSKLEHDLSVPATLKKDLIEACGSLELVETAGVIIDYFTKENVRPEVRISCIRASGRLVAATRFGSSNLASSQALWAKIILPGLGDEDWRIRAVAAGAAAACPPELLPHMVKLLHDPSYYVRLNAGKALAASGPEGMAALTGESGSQDRFTRDTVLYLLQQKKGS